jgi:hypothetical protein
MPNYLHYNIRQNKPLHTFFAGWTKALSQLKELRAETFAAFQGFEKQPVLDFRCTALKTIYRSP